MSNSDKKLTVTAIQKGFIYGLLREPGEVFELEDEKHFSKNWMAEGSVKVKEPHITHATLKKRKKQNPNQYPELEPLESPSIAQIRAERGRKKHRA